MVSFLGHFQIVFLPATILILLWFIYLTVVKKDTAAGFVLLIGLVIIADSYMSTGIFLFGLEKGSIRYSEIVLGFLFFAGAGMRRNHLTLTNLFRSRLFSYWIVFLVLVLVSIIRSPAPLQNFLFNFRHLVIAPVLIFLIASTGFGDVRSYRKFIFYLMFLVMILNVAQMQQIFFDRIFIEAVTFEKAYSNISQSRRFFSFFNNPNMLGCFYVTIFPLIIAFMVVTRGIARKGAIFLMLLLTLFCFFKTYSRGSYVGMTASLLPFVFLKVRNISSWGKVAVVILLFTSILIFSPGIYESVSKRVFTVVETQEEEEAEESELSRSELWSNVLIILRDNPLFGIGWGEDRFREKIYEHRFEIASQNIAKAIFTASHPHNSYLYIAVFMGSIALLVFLFMVKNILSASFGLTRMAADPELEIICLALFSGILGFLVTIFFDYQLFVKSNSVTFWVVAGLTVSFYGIHRDKFKLNVSGEQEEVIKAV